MISSSIDLADSRFLTAWHKLHCYKLSQSYIFHFYYFQNLVETLFYSLALFLCYNFLVVLGEKCYEFSIFMIILACIFIYQLDIILKKKLKN